MSEIDNSTVESTNTSAKSPRHVLLTTYRLIHSVFRVRLDVILQMIGKLPGDYLPRTWLRRRNLLSSISDAITKPHLFILFLVNSSVYRYITLGNLRFKSATTFIQKLFYQNIRKPS
jgi:hypothetical protein